MEACRGEIMFVKVPANGRGRIQVQVYLDLKAGSLYKSILSAMWPVCLFTWELVTK